MKDAVSRATLLMGDPDPIGLIYRAVRAAADQGRPAPTNAELADRIGAKSTSTAVRFLQRLVEQRVIKIEDGNMSRRITIVATGKSTRVSSDFVPVSAENRAARARKISAALTLPRIAPAISGQEELQAHERKMTASSAALARAMQSYTPVMQRRHEARRLTTLNPLPVDRPTPIARRPAVPFDTRPPAPSRNPCPRCATRGDLGCAHFAPCEPAPSPKAERFPSMELHS